MKLKFISESVKKMLISFMNWLMICFSSRYGNFRLIDIPGLKRIMPVTMATFMKHVADSSLKGARLLTEHWLKECCSIIDDRREDIEYLMPLDDQVRNSQIPVEHC